MVKMSKKRTVALLLALLLLSSGMYSCSDTPADQSGEDTTVNTTPPVTPSGETDTAEEYSILSTLPEYTFDGATVTTMTRNDSPWQITALDAEEMTGETINDAIYTRNMRFEGDYNAAFKVEYIAGSLVDPVKTIVASGDTTYDFIVPHLADGAILAADDQFINLNTVSTLDFTNPAWDQNAVDFYSIAHKLYYGVSDIALGKNETAWIYMFNKRLLAEYNLENPYELVREKKWTFDKSLEMMAAASNDTNGNGEVDVGDHFGLSTHSVNYYALLISAGENIAVKDENDSPVMSINSERFVDVYDKIKNSFTDPSQTSMVSGLDFPDGKCLLCGQVLACVRLWRDMEDDFGIIPTPMYDESQASYCTYVIPYEVFASVIPVSAADPERSGIAMQALAIYSAYYLTPAYYEITITGKGLRDEESIEMLDIILDSTVYDIARMYDWGGFPSSLASMLAEQRDLTSTYQRRAKMIDKEIAATVEAIQNNNN